MWISGIHLAFHDHVSYWQILHFRPLGKGSVGRCIARGSPSLLSESPCRDQKLLKDGENLRMCWKWQHFYFEDMLLLMTISGNTYLSTLCSNYSEVGNVRLHMTISVKAILFTGHLKANFDNIRFVPCKDLPTNKVIFTNSFFNYRMFKAHREVRQVRWWLIITNY